ncbi:hypothetical protein D3C72_1555610 [compost metagenome]
MCKSHEGAENHQQHPQYGLEQLCIQQRQKAQPERQSAQPAQYKGPQHAPVKAAPHTESLDDLPGKSAKDGQRGGKRGLQRPCPQRHRRHAVAKARQALHKAREGRSQDDDYDFHS